MKPASVKWINGLIILRISMILMLIILGSIAILTSPEKGFLKGFNDVMLELKMYKVEDEVGENLGSLLGLNLIPIIFCSITYIALNQKKRTLFYTFAALDILLYMTSVSLPLLPIIVMILGLLKTTRVYFEKYDVQKIDEAPNL